MFLKINNMLNTQLQQDINIEIEKAEDSVKAFLMDGYFRDTVDLILKVNKLTPDQGESVELETVMHILKISDYEKLEDGIKNECGIQNEQTIVQVVKDIRDYILSKLSAAPQEIKVMSSEVDTKPLRNIIQDAYGKDVMGPVVLDYYEDRRLEESVPQIENTQTKKEIPMIKNDIMHDVYRELPSAEDSDAEKIKQVGN